MVFGLVRIHSTKNYLLQKNHDYFPYLLKNDDIFTKYQWHLVVGMAFSFKTESPMLILTSRHLHRSNGIEKLCCGKYNPAIIQL